MTQDLLRIKQEVVLKVRDLELMLIKAKSEMQG